MKVKFYNKIVSNFEAGDTQNKNGSHLSEYAYNHSDKRLKNVFFHPEVKKCGVTRIEVSLLCPNVNTNYTDVLKQEYDFVKNEEIFHIQPGAQQWDNLTQYISKNCVIADRTNRSIFVCWYASTKTGRTAGVNIREKGETKKKEKSKKEFEKWWKKRKEKSVEEFCFNNTLIHLVEYEVIKNEKNETILIFKPLKCYEKRGNTILCPTNKPTMCFNEEKYPDLPDVNDVLPHTYRIKFVFRTEKLKKEFGKNKKFTNVDKIPELTGFNKLVLLSKKKRKERIREDEYLKLSYGWKKKQKEIQEKRKEENEEKLKKIRKEIEEHTKIIQKRKKAESRFSTVEQYLKEWVVSDIVEEKLRNLKKIKLYAFKEFTVSGCITMLYGELKKSEILADKLGVCYANGQIKHFLKHKCKEIFFKEIELKNKTDKKKGVRIFCMPLHSIILDCSNPKNIVLDKEYFDKFKTKMNLTKINQEMEEYFKEYEKLQEELKILEQQPKPLENSGDIVYSFTYDTAKETVKSDEYEVNEYGTSEFRGRIYKVLYISKPGKEEEKQPIRGFFLQEELDKIPDLSKVKAPIKVLIGEKKNHKVKKGLDKQITLYYELL